MNIEEQITADIKNAMRAKDKVALGALRAVKKVIIELKSAVGASGEVSDEDCTKIINKLSKQGKDAAQIYKEQDREDLYDDEIAQVKIFEKYLPAQLSDEELTAAVKAIIAECGATSMKEMGMVMGNASKKLAGKADGKLISAKVKELLA
jgi:uncharacterized protein YqeY